jgi:hypothetical protein
MTLDHTPRAAFAAPSLAPAATIASGGSSTEPGRALPAGQRAGADVRPALGLGLGHRHD